MSSRKLKIETNTKYVPMIMEVVSKHAKRLDVDNTDLSQIHFKDSKKIFNDILNELSYNIHLKEHRLRYQQEQKQRYYNSVKCFNYYYALRNKSLEEFVEDYNTFLWSEIKKSHYNLSPKIEANYRRNYHEGEVSPITSLVFYLYFKTNKVQKFLSQLLISAYRNPYTNKQKNIV